MQVNDTHKSRKSTGLLALVCLFLHLGIAPQFALGLGTINFAFLFVAYFALTKGGKSSIVLGFFAGLIYDLTTTGPIGLMALLLSVTGFGLGLEARNRLSDDTMGALLIFFIFDVVVALFYNITLLLTGDATGIIDVLFIRAVPSAFLCAIAWLPFLWVATHTSSVKPALGSSLKASHAKGKKLKL